MVQQLQSSCAKEYRLFVPELPAPSIELCDLVGKHRMLCCERSKPGVCFRGRSCVVSGFVVSLLVQIMGSVATFTHDIRTCFFVVSGWVLFEERAVDPIHRRTQRDLQLRKVLSQLVRCSCCFHWLFYVMNGHTFDRFGWTYIRYWYSLQMHFMLIVLVALVMWTALSAMLALLFFLPFEIDNSTHHVNRGNYLSGTSNRSFEAEFFLAVETLSTVGYGCVCYYYCCCCCCLLRYKAK